MSIIEDVDLLLENSEQNSLTLFLDSKNRDYEHYNTPSKYVVNFDLPIRNVFGFEVLDASLPVTAYNIDDGANTLSLTHVFLSIGNTFANFQDLFVKAQSYYKFMEFQKNINLPYINIFLCSDEQGFNDMSNVSDIETNHLILYVEGNSSNFKHKYCNDSDAFIYAADLGNNGIRFDVLLCMTNFEIEKGNYTSETLNTYLSLELFVDSYNPYVKAIHPDGLFQVSFVDNVINGGTSKTSTFKFTYNKSDPFFFDMEKSTVKCALGFSEYSRQNNKLYEYFYNKNKQLFLSYSEFGLTQTLISPGIINLESARYVILRCPEIENHILGSYGNFKFSPGVSLFKMTDTNSMQQLRFDFVNVIRKPFHPIGKLNRLSLSFENQDGTLYNFKGVDHQLLISIKYYAPKNTHRLPKSILNPYYNPNILEYSFKKEIPRTDEKQYDVDKVILEQAKYMS